MPHRIYMFPSPLDIKCLFAVSDTMCLTLLSLRFRDYSQPS